MNQFLVRPSLVSIPENIPEYPGIPEWTISLPARAIASATFLKRKFDHSEPKAFYSLNNLAAKAKRHGLTSQEYLAQRSSWKFDERDHKFYPPT